MTEAATFQMPSALRRLFATILVFCEATEIRKLWDKHLPSMCEDYSRNESNESVLAQMVLRDIRDMLQSMGKDIKSYGLPDLVETDGSYDSEYREVTEERQITADTEHLDLFSSLNHEQLAGFNDIMDHVMNKKSQIFFVDGPGGTRKTYLYKALLAKVRSVAMTKRQAGETLDRSLQDIMECSLPFGGKVVVFGGDFRQVLPVVTRGTRAQITDATLLRSYLWEKTHKIRLTRNMRAHADPWFSEYLLRIGNGTEETIGDDYVRLPEDIVIGYTEDEKAINMLIEDVFPSLQANARSREYMSARAIHSTMNDHVDDLNDKMISRFPGEEKIMQSMRRLL
uniref:ATP-dependent DNA helicase n=1 Tax=Aegilops tauschii subsp. strangulata TaxID=200361 RepID=A0A452XX60_AEGTS